MSLLRLRDGLAALEPVALPAFLAALVVSVMVPTPVAAQGSAAKLPPELAVIPPDSFAFLYLRPAELWQSEPAARLRKMFPQDAEQLLKSLGDDPRETESLIFLYPSLHSLGILPPLGPRRHFDQFDRPPFNGPAGKIPPANASKNEPDGVAGMVLIETTVKPVPQAHVLERVLGKGAVAIKHGSRTYFAQKDKGGFLPGAVYFVNDRTYVFAFTTEAMIGLLTKLDAPRAKSPLAGALDQAARKRHVVLGVNAERPEAAAIRRELTEEWSFERGPLPTFALVPLLEVRSAVIAFDIGKDLKLEAELRFPDARSATKASGAVEDALFLGRFVLNALLRSERRHEKPGREERTHLPLIQTLGEMLLPQLEKGLRRANIEQRQEVLHLQAGVVLNFEPLQDLGLRDDFAIIHVRVAELMHTEFAVEFVKMFPERFREQPFRKLEELGLPVNAIESATLVLPTSQSLSGRPRAKPDFKKSGPPFEKFDDKKFDPPPVELPKPDKPSPKGFDPDKENPKSGEVLIRSETAGSFVSQPGFDGDEDDVYMLKVTTLKPLDRKKVLQGMLGNVHKEVKHRSKTYFVPGRDRFGEEAVHFVDERTVLIAPAYGMGRVLDRPVFFRAKGPFAEAVEAAKKKHPFVFAANLTEASVLFFKQQIAADLSRTRDRGDGMELALGRALLPLIDARTFIVSLNEVSGPSGKEVRVQADMTFADSQQAAACKDAAQDALTLGRLYILSRLRMELSTFQVERTLHDDFDNGPIVFGNQVLVPGEKPVLVPRRDLRPALVGAGLLAHAETVVRKAKVEQYDATLRAVAQARFDWKELVAQAREEAVALVKKDTADRQIRKSMTNMQRLINAMHVYQEVHGKFPTSDNLSWRVHVLPYMDELGLYKEFKLNEPWDSPHNIKLLPRMPKIFAAPDIKPKEPFTTHYQLFTEPETGLDGKAKIRNFDGIVLVQAYDATPWTKPTDLVYDGKKPLPKLGGVFPDGFHAADLRGEVVFWPLPLNEARFRARIMGSQPLGVREEKFDK